MHYLLRVLINHEKQNDEIHEIKNTDSWAKIISHVLDVYNNSPHSVTKIAPNKVNKDHEIQVLMNISK